MPAHPLELDSLPPLGSQELLDPIVCLRFTSRRTGRSWYVIEGCREHDDFRFYGYRADGLPTRTYFLLSELRDADAERDDHFSRSPWSLIRRSISRASVSRLR